MKLSGQRQGELFITGATLLWGIFPVLATLSYSDVTPFISLSVSSLFSACFFACILTVRHRWHEVTHPKAALYSLIATFIIGICYYLLFFFGLRYSTPGNISMLALTEAFFSFLLFHVWRREHLPREHIYGALFILSGAAIVLAPTVSALRSGDLFILAGAAIAPLGNLYVQKARKLVHTETVMFVRGIVGSPVILILAYAFHAVSPVSSVWHSLTFLMINGVVILGLSTMMWVEGIHRIPVTKANALSGMGPIVTFLAAWIVFHTSPTFVQLAAFIPLFLGILLLGKDTGTIRV